MRLRLRIFRSEEGNQAQDEGNTATAETEQNQHDDVGISVHSVERALFATAPSRAIIIIVVFLALSSTASPVIITIIIIVIIVAIAGHYELPSMERSAAEYSHKLVIHSPVVKHQPAGIHDFSPSQSSAAGSLDSALELSLQFRVLLVSAQVGPSVLNRTSESCVPSLTLVYSTVSFPCAPQVRFVSSSSTFSAKSTDIPISRRRLWCLTTTRRCYSPTPA